MPFAMSEEYYREAGIAGDRATLVTLTGAGHFEPIDPRSGEWIHTVQSLRRALGLVPARRGSHRCRR